MYAGPNHTMSPWRGYPHPSKIFIKFCNNFMKKKVNLTQFWAPLWKISEDFLNFLWPPTPVFDRLICGLFFNLKINFQVHHERRDSLSSLITSSSDDMIREYNVQQPPQQQHRQQHNPYQPVLFPPPSFKMPGPPPIPSQQSSRLTTMTL